MRNTFLKRKSITKKGIEPTGFVRRNVLQKNPIVTRKDRFKPRPDNSQTLVLDKKKLVTGGFKPSNGFGRDVKPIKSKPFVPIKVVRPIKIKPQIKFVEPQPQDVFIESFILPEPIIRNPIDFIDDKFRTKPIILPDPIFRNPIDFIDDKFRTKPIILPDPIVRNAGGFRDNKFRTKPIIDKAISRKEIIEKLILDKPIEVHKLKRNDIPLSNLDLEYSGKGRSIDGTWFPDQGPIGFDDFKADKKEKTMFPTIILPKIGNTQTINITGRVIDENQQPMPFVEVFIESNPSIGTITDNNGNYSIAAKPTENVVFSLATYSQSFLASAIPGTLQILPNNLDTVDLGTVNKPKISLAGFGVVGILLAALALGGGVKAATPPKPKRKRIQAKGMRKPASRRKRTKTVVI